MYSPAAITNPRRHLLFPGLNMYFMNRIGRAIPGCGSCWSCNPRLRNVWLPPAKRDILKSEYAVALRSWTHASLTKSMMRKRDITQDNNRPCVVASTRVMKNEVEKITALQGQSGAPHTRNKPLKTRNIAADA